MSVPVWLEGQLTQGRSMAVRFEHLRPSLQTGDVILYTGTGAFSRLIQLATRSIWSHAAMVVRDGDNILTWESDRHGVKERRFEEEYKLTDALKDTREEGEVVAVRLLACTRSDAMLTAYQTFKATVQGREFEKDKLELVKAALGLSIGGEDLSSLFCSELVAATWQRMGLLTLDRDSNWFAPKDFSSLGAVRPLRGSLGDEIIVVP